MVVFGYAFATLGRWPSPAQIATALVFLALAVLILYSIWILVVSAAFWVVKVDNLTYLFGSLFDVGRWPIDVLRGVWRGSLALVFTFVIPLALMTTYPALALLGRLDGKTAAWRWRAASCSPSSPAASGGARWRCTRPRAADAGRPSDAGVGRHRRERAGVRLRGAP